MPSGRKRNSKKNKKNKQRRRSESTNDPPIPQISDAISSSDTEISDAPSESTNDPQISAAISDSETEVDPDYKNALLYKEDLKVFLKMLVDKSVFTPEKNLQRSFTEWFKTMTIAFTDCIEKFDTISSVEKFMIDEGVPSGMVTLTMEDLAYFTNKKKARRANRRAYERYTERLSESKEPKELPSVNSVPKPSILSESGSHSPVDGFVPVLPSQGPGLSSTSSNVANLVESYDEQVDERNLHVSSVEKFPRSEEKNVTPDGDASVTAEGRRDRNANIQDLKSDLRGTETEVKEAGEARSTQNGELNSHEEIENRTSEKREKVFCSQASNLSVDMERDRHLITEEPSIPEDSKAFGQSVQAEDENGLDSRGVSEKLPESDSSSELPQFAGTNSKGKKQATKISQGLNRADSYDEQSPLILAVQERIDQVQQIVNERRNSMNDELIAEIKKLLREEVAKMVPVLKSAVRSEVKDIVLSENSKSQRELNLKLEAIIAAKEQHSQLALTLQETIASATSLVSELAESQRSLKAQAELSRWISEGKYEESFTLALRRNDVSIVSWLCSQVDLRRLLAMSRLPLSQGVLLSLLQQLACDITKDTSRKLAWMTDVLAAINPLDDTIVVHGGQILEQVRQVLEHQCSVLGSDVNAITFIMHVINSMHKGCKTMFDQVESAFQKGIADHTSAAQQRIDSGHSQLAHTLRESITSASSVARELAESQRNLIALAATGANAGGSNPLASQLSGGHLSALLEKVEAPMDPTAELSRLIAERKYEESFTLALQRIDVSIVSWLCLQVDLRRLLAMSPLPLSQGVLLSLLQQLACDISNDTSRKLAWMTDVVAAINPSDQLISVHARPILTQVYQILHELPTATESNVSAIILLTHNISHLRTRLSDSAPSPQRTRK